MMKKMIVLTVLVGGVLAHSGKLYSAAPPTKVGIQKDEVDLAKDLAKNTGDEQLYRLLGGKDGFIEVTEELTQDKVNQIFWPVLVWAIEEGNVNLTEKLLKFIGIDDKKPYGKAFTPRNIAKYHNQQDILNLINQFN